MSKDVLSAIKIAGIASIIAAFIVVSIMAGINEPGADSGDKTTLYEQQLLTDSVLQQQAENFSTPQNILELFHGHKEQLQKFADQCYENRKKQSRFFVQYINDEPYYFSTEDDIDEAHLTKEMAIAKGTYDDITAFMNYAVNSGLAFKEWMIAIETPNPVDADEFWEKRNHNYGALLFITIYKGKGLNIAFLYSPYEDVDYSYEYYGMAVDSRNPEGGSKIVRIDSHWYYQYVISNRSDAWCPDSEALGFCVVE